MAEFNPQTQDTGVSNMTGASQGQIPDRSFETLFEGLTKTFENVTNIKDTQTQLDIRKDATEMFEGVNQEFGVEPPAAMADELDRIQELQNAVEQGKISQVNYYGRLATLSKQLRVKYPRYEKIVDETIQSVTGTRPANAYRDAIFQEINDLQASADADTKFRRQYEKDFQGEIALIYGEDYFQNRDKYDFEEVQSKVAGFEGEAKEIESETKKLQLAANRGEFNEKQGKKVLDQHMNFIVSATLERSLGLNQPSAQESLDAFISKGGGSPEELDQFIGKISQVETSLRAELTKTGREKFGGIMTNQQINESVEQALYPITEAKKAVLGGDFKLAEKFATINKAMKDQSLGDLLQDPTYRVGAGISEINQVLGDVWFNENKDQAFKTAQDIVGQQMLGQKGVVKKVIESGNEKVSRAVIQESFRAIIDPKLTGDKFSKVVDEFFGPDAIDFMKPDGSVVARDDLQKIYLRYLSPEVTQAIYSKGSETDKKNYYQWAIEKAAAIPEFRSAAGNINSLQEFARREELNLKIEFDPNTMQFKSNGRWAAQRYITDINKVFAVLNPIWEAEGENAPQAAQELIQSLSIQLDPPKTEGKQGFFGSLLEMMSMSAEASEGDREAPAAEEIDIDDIDFVTTQAIEEGGRRTTPTQTASVPDESTRNFLDMIGQAEGAGYDTIFGHNERRYGVVPTEMTLEEVFKVQRRMGKELGSSAFGKYQIIQKTLKNAVEEMGLPLDTVFSEEVQDAIALHLAKGRGYELYRQGKMKGREFLNNLAKEWASIPNTSGRSHYAGDRMGNKATRAGRRLASQFT